MADEQATGMGCPTCWNGGSGIQAMLFARAGKHSYYCRTGHEFNDLQELQALNPPRLQVPQKQAVQQGHETVQLSIPQDLKQQLLQKFGSPERLAQTLSGVLRTLSENQCFLMNEIDIDRIEKEVGQRPKTGAELFGIIYERNRKVVELMNAGGSSAAPAATIAVPEGHLVIDASSFRDKAAALAKFRSQKLETVLEQTLKMALDNGWA